MRLALVLALALAALMSWTAPATAQINGPHVFLGFTSATFQGDQGVLTYHGACAAEFPNSRMCTSIEILQTPESPTGLSGTAWVQPTFQPTGTTSAVDASGVSTSSQSGTCAGWRTNTGYGLIVDSDGRFQAGTTPTLCSDFRSIACCGPPIQVSEGDLNQDGVVNLVDDTIMRRMLAGLPVYLP